MISLLYFRKDMVGILKQVNIDISGILKISQNIRLKMLHDFGENGLYWVVGEFMCNVMVWCWVFVF